MLSLFVFVCPFIIWKSVPKKSDYVIYKRACMGHRVSQISWWASPLIVRLIIQTFSVFCSSLFQASNVEITLFFRLFGADQWSRWRYSNFQSLDICPFPFPYFTRRWAPHGFKIWSLVATHVGAVTVVWTCRQTRSLYTLPPPVDNVLQSAV